MDTIIRVHKDLNADPFARIDKVPINSDQMSFKALGILTYLLSKPDGWDTRVSQLIKAKTDRDKSVRSGIKELIDLKHILRIRLIDSRGRIVKWTYIVYERPYQEEYQAGFITMVIDPLTQKGEVDSLPLTHYPEVDNPEVDNPEVDKDPPINNVFKQLINKVTNKDNNNNNTHQDSSAPNVVVEIPNEKQIQYLKLYKRAKNLGWIGSPQELKEHFNKDPDYLAAWIEKIEGTTGLDNPAGLLRKGLRSRDRPQTAREIELSKLIEMGIEKEEAEAMI